MAGKTLWEILRGKLTPTMELQIDNPLKVRCGGMMQVNTIETDGLTFSVQTISEYRRTAADMGTKKDLTFTDYDLLARPLGKEDVTAKVRLMPLGMSLAGQSHTAVVLSLYHQCGYDEGLYNAVTAGTKLFECFNDGVLTARYFRINDLNDAFTATVKTLRDEDGNGKVEEDEVMTRQVQYWDYWREINDEAGQTFNEFCFVEMDKDNGFFQIWTGREVDLNRVTVL